MIFKKKQKEGKPDGQRPEKRTYSRGNPHSGNVDTRTKGRIPFRAAENRKFTREKEKHSQANSLKALLARNTVTPVEVVAELESIEASIAAAEESLAAAEEVYGPGYGLE